MSDLLDALREVPPPDAAAEDRAWRLAHAAYVRRPTPPQRHRTRPLGAAGVALALTLAMTLTPAGGSVVKLVRQIATSSPEPVPRPLHATGLRRLPGGGLALILREGGAYLVGDGPPARRLGPADLATFSAFGHYAALARGRALTVVALDGRRVWSLREPRPISAIAWAPDGLRVAYRAGARLRVVDGNGEDPRTLRRAAGRALAWRPGGEPLLAYVRRPGLVLVTDVSTGADVARLRAPARTFALDWSADGRRLLALAPRQLRVYDARGRVLARRHAARGETLRAAAFAPHFHHIALLGHRPGRDVLSVAGRPVVAATRLGAPTWSPDGRWLLAAGSGHWWFVPAPLASSPRPFGSVVVAVRGSAAGWCCQRTAGGRRAS